MKNVKQIRENYDLITEKEEAENRKLTSLVRAGLYDAKKLPALKKALEKSPDKMTGQEKRMLINLLDSLINQVVSSDQVYRKVKQNVQHVNEAKEDHLSKFDPRFKAGYPTDKDIPTVIILKRKAIRVYPDNQKVALYYSQALDKYVTIPFNDIQVGLNEQKKPEKTEQEKEDEKLLKGKRSTNLKTFTSSYDEIRRSSGSRAVAIGGALGSMSYYKKKRKEAMARATAKKSVPAPAKSSKKKSTPAAPAPVPIPAPAKSTSKESTSVPQLRMRSPEATARRMKKNPKVDYAKGAIDHAAKATRKEEFELKLQEIREARQYGKVDAALDAASFVPGPAGSVASLASAAASLTRGDYVGAALDAAGALPGVGYAAKAAKVARAASKVSDASKVVKAGNKTVKKNTFARNVMAAYKKNKRKRDRRPDIDVEVNNDNDNSNNNNNAGAASASSGTSNYVLPTSKREYGFNKSVNGENSWKNRTTSTAAQDQRDKQQYRRSQMEETVLPKLRSIVENNISQKTLTINEQNVNINNTSAKKILHVYESVNSTNKKKMEKMLNESADSFNKILTFAIRQ